MSPATATTTPATGSKYNIVSQETERESKTMKTTKTTATTTPATEKKTPATFAEYLTAFSTAYTNKESDPSNYEKTLFELAKLCTLSVLKKVIDPTRHNSIETPATLLNNSDPGDPVKRYSYGDRGTAINSGFSPALVSVRRQLFTACETLAREANDFVEHDDFMAPATGLNQIGRAHV